MHNVERFWLWAVIFVLFVGMLNNSYRLNVHLDCEIVNGHHSGDPYVTKEEFIALRDSFVSSRVSFQNHTHRYHDGKIRIKQ